ncbi:ATP-dependent DNA ligase [Lapillicoccus jejuensis]|uniref:DNA ligase (ATP) n=1 Tax=Lapillicoccus jejuensis TaxID=402171 RepID=A0A542E5G0_9MICO|nr:ATP-dependent DNA ligase [Lapillicoccus jejuensis]TQJ10547.1 ATP-dependent DNA ligase [Lapillicoccus jejuensis]
MRQPLDLPVQPMLAKAVDTVPAADSVRGGLAYEPKWDGFRCLVLRDGDEVELASRGSKPLTRYFPEVVDAVRRLLPQRCVVDAEVVVRSGEPGAERLQWEQLSQRIHPAQSRITRLSRETPAELVCFDLLALGDEALLDRPFRERRARLEEALAHLGAADPVHLTRITTDADVARDWFERFEGAGLDGVVAKPLEQPYAPNKRTMLKIKHHRTADAVVYGYRVHKSGQGVGSLLLGLYDDAPDEGGSLFGVGGIAAFTAKRRLELVDELAPLVVRDDEGRPEAAETDRSRFSGSKDVSYVPLRPERVVEVAFDQLEGRRFRHAVTFLRWRPDRDAPSCRIEQVDRAPAYDLGEVLGG